MALPTKLQTEKQDAETLMNILQQQKNDLGENHVFFKNNPNIIANLQATQDEILAGAENLDVNDQESGTNRAGLWEDLLEFVERLKQYYKITSTKGAEVPAWMHYKPQTSQEGLDFFQGLFENIENELSQDFKSGFDGTSPMTIQDANDKFTEWKQGLKGEDWDVYMQKVNQMSDFIHLLRGTLKMTGMTFFEIKSNLYEDEG